VKKLLIFSSIVGLASLLSSCMVDQYGNVIPAGPVYAGGPGYYGSYGDPYFIYGGINYYSYNGRYCYYNHGRRMFVSNLPSGGRYYHGGGHHYSTQSYSTQSYGSSAYGTHTKQYSHHPSGGTFNQGGQAVNHGPQFHQTSGHIAGGAIVPAGKTLQKADGGKDKNKNKNQ
jgi:hypothetical protein